VFGRAVEGDGKNEERCQPQHDEPNDMAQIILRKWSSRIRTADRPAYVDYVLRTGAGDYGKTPGNLGFQVVTRDLGDGTTAITTLSWWQSLDSIRVFAGREPEIARYYQEDDRFLLDRPQHVEHYVVEAGRVSVDI
jgi:heme-degrading monooxygenase HmoA